MNLSRFHRDMDALKDQVLQMGDMVEQALADASAALLNRRPLLARRVIEDDGRTDQMENEIEARCVKLLATQQPVAVDLRFIAGALRITRDLERLGDQCVNLAHRTIDLCSQEPLVLPQTLRDMVDIARQMTRSVLNALASQNTTLAEEVIARDDQLDDLNRKLLEEMILWMNQEQRVIRRGVELIIASRHLERVGDEATNVAETVVYMVRGEVIRHQPAVEASQPG